VCGCVCVCVCSSVTSSDVLNLLRTSHVLLVLVDRRFLHCSSCCSSSERAAHMAHPEFVGHFVLLIGIEADVQGESSTADSNPLLRYLDPACRHAPCTAPLSSIDRARLSSKLMSSLPECYTLEAFCRTSLLVSVCCDVRREGVRESKRQLAISQFTVNVLFQSDRIATCLCVIQIPGCVRSCSFTKFVEPERFPLSRSPDSSASAP
jgi:hypothetical protein